MINTFSILLKSDVAIRKADMQKFRFCNCLHPLISASSFTIDRLYLCKLWAQRSYRCKPTAASPRLHVSRFRPPPYGSPASGTAKLSHPLGKKVSEFSDWRGQEGRSTIRSPRSVIRVNHSQSPRAPPAQEKIG